MKRSGIDAHLPRLVRHSCSGCGCKKWRHVGTITASDKRFVIRLVECMRCGKFDDLNKPNTKPQVRDASARHAGGAG